MRPPSSAGRLLLAVLLLVVSFGCSSSGFMLVKCPPDDRPVMILKDIENAYPVYAVGYDANLIATLNVLSEWEASADVSTKTSIVSLREKLNNESARFEALLKTALIGLQKDACGPNDHFWNLLKELNQKSVELREIPKTVEQKMGARLTPGEIAAIVGSFEGSYDFHGLE